MTITRLATIKLLGSTIRIGRTPASGPIFMLESFEHSRDRFTTRNVHNGVKGTITALELSTAIAEGIAHPSRVPGGIYHA